VLRCPLCGGVDRKLLYPSTLRLASARQSPYECTNVGLGIHPEIFRCLHCALVYNEPAPLDASPLEEYARIEDPEYLEQRDARRLTYGRELDRLEELVSGRDLLDVGCYAGFFLELARERGFRVSGVEPSRWAALHAAQQLGLDVFNGPLEVFDTERRYDLVTLWDVIEHLADPLGALRRVKSLLRPAGLVAFTTHNIDSLLARLLRSRYPFFMQMHAIHLDDRTLPLLVERAGFTIVRRHAHRRAVHVGYLLTRLQRFGARPEAWAQRAAALLGLADRIVWIGGVGLETVIARPAANR